MSRFQRDCTKPLLMMTCLGIVVAMVFGTVCGALGMLLAVRLSPTLFFAPTSTPTARPSSTPTPIPPSTPTTLPSPTPTPTSTKSVLPNIAFGSGKSSATCTVSQTLETITQEALIESEELYLVVPFTTDDIGKTIEVSWIGPTGERTDSQKTLTSGLQFCYSEFSGLSYKTPPGDYAVEVRSNGQVVYRHVLTIEYSDLSSYPRPQREPLGDFTLGRDGIANQVCRVNTPTTTVTQAELAASPWFYFVSSYTSDEIGNPLYWTVYGPGNAIVYDRTERILEDDIYLCFWQGFGLGRRGPGEYRLIIEYGANIIYEATIRIR